MDQPVSLHIDMPWYSKPIEQDDFVVTVGENKSNSVYHVLSVKTVPRTNGITRNYFKAYKSDLITALRRSETQRLITLKWYKR